MNWVPFHVDPWDIPAIMGLPPGWYIRRGSTVDARKTFRNRRQAWAVCRRLNREGIRS